jgi:hypothetical protein
MTHIDRWITVAPRLMRLAAADQGLLDDLLSIVATETDACAHECLYRAVQYAVGAPERAALADVGSALRERAMTRRPVTGG